MYERGGNAWFQRINAVLISIGMALCIVPFLHIASVSLSSNRAILSGEVTVFPLELNFEAYAKVLQDDAMIRSLLFTIGLTVVYTALALAMTVIAAYPLTKRTLRGRKVILFLITFTMFFSGGTIPEYILVKGLNVINSVWALILPNIINPFFLIILVSFFRSIPTALSEAAELDGCSQFGMLVRIVLPLSLPALATIGLFYAVGRWNGFMDALMYITNVDLYPIQLKLYQIVMNSMTNDTTVMDGNLQIQVLPESMKAAGIMLASLPILLVYPWLQRFFISGVMIGSIKE